MERMTGRLEIKNIAEDTGVITGYGSVFNVVDYYNDVVAPGAFKRSLEDMNAKQQRIPMLWQHNADAPVGVWNRLREDDHGLLLEGQLAVDTTLGGDAIKLARLGAVTGLSIGFRTVKYTIDKNDKTRTITDLDLWEVSLVTFPACDTARVTGVKGREVTPRELEHILHNAGFSRDQAKAIIAKGHAGLSQREAGGDQREAETIEAALRTTLKLIGS